MKRLSAQESKCRWEVLRKRQRSTKASQHTRQQYGEPALDPFDCSSLAVPPSKELVDNVLGIFSRQWKSLDERKVIAGESMPRQTHVSNTVTESSSHAGSSGNNNVEDDGKKNQLASRSRRGRHGERWGWHKGRVKLPFEFDYASRRSSPPPPNADGDRLISLDNPSLQIPYERELWELFRSVPTSDELEQPLRKDSLCSHSRKLCAEIVESTTHPAMLRLRINDRHCLPTPLSSKSTTTNATMCTTIRIECLKRQLKRGGSPECHRLELEFLSTQTLADLHNSIVEMSNDDLWPNSKNEKIASGFFFIEDNFYTFGDVDYVTHIRKWLDDTSDQTDTKYKNLEKLPRRSYLGIDPKLPLEVKSMEQTQLGSLNFRLGVRYCHAHHGDVECSVFVTDICHTTKSRLPYPIVHDAWSSFSVECEGCKRLPAVLVTPPGASMTNGCVTALCKTCFRQLYSKSSATVGEERVPTQKYHAWREQSDLSVGHEPANTPFRNA